jgi:voltage-gated potassium channel Kch
VGSRVDNLVHSFQEGPASVRNAIRLIVAATIVTTVLGGVLVRIFDHKDFHTIGDALWWALQTVTTVGYGDVTPRHVSGRIVAAFVMFEGIAFLAIVTAAIASTFVARVVAEREASETSEEMTEMQRIESRLDVLDGKLDRLEAALRGSGQN